MSATIGWDGDDILYENGSINVEKLGVATTLGAADNWAIYDRDWTGSMASEHEADGFSAVSTSPWKVQCNGTGGGNSAGKPATFKTCTYGQKASQGGGSDPSFTSSIWTPLSAQRSDGYSDGVNNFQGVRAYDPNMNQWTTPDAYSGDVHDPMSQKPYMWNGNNPVAYSDPSGYVVGVDDAIEVGAASAVVVEGGATAVASIAEATGNAAVAASARGEPVPIFRTCDYAAIGRTKPRGRRR